MTEIVSASLAECASVLDALRRDSATQAAIVAAGGALATAMRSGNRVFSCGNGGSFCDAAHFAEELSGRYRRDRPALAAQAISDAAHLTCVANDYGYEMVFARYLEAHGRADDVLVALSTSGTSPNILRAAEVARRKSMVVVALTGRPGSPLAAVADIEICTPGGRYADRVQELHIKVIHILIELVERDLFPALYAADTGTDRSVPSGLT